MLLGLALALAGPVSAYDTVDLLGRWRIHGLASGPGAPWWERALATVAANGDFTATTLTNVGELDTVQATFALSPTGVLTMPGGAVFRGALDIGRTVFVTTDTWAGGAPGTTELKVGLKTVGAYATSDLAGEWELAAIASGPGAPWWLRGRISLTSDGDFSGSLTDSEGSTDPTTGSFVITPDGVVALSVASLASGAMDAGRTVMAVTNTWTGFMSGTTELAVLLKMAPGYAPADLAGTWELQSLATGPGAPWWSRGTISVAANGAYTGTVTESGGGSHPVSGTFALAPNGVLTRSGSTSARGALDAGRSVMVWTETWSTGAPGTSELLIGVRTGGSTTGVGGTPDEELALDGVDPNPLRGGRLSVRFRLAERGAARLDLLDLGGRLVATESLAARAAGRHQASIDGASRLAPGLYWLRLHQGSSTRTRRVVVL